MAACSFEKMPSSSEDLDSEEESPCFIDVESEEVNGIGKIEVLPL